VNGFQIDEFGLKLKAQELSIFLVNFENTAAVNRGTAVDFGVDSGLCLSGRSDLGS